MPLWSGVLLGSLDRYKTVNDAEDCGKDDSDNYPFLSFTSANAKSEGYIEGAMRHLKQEDFPGKKRLRPDVFVSENYKRTRRRVNDFADCMHSRMLPKRKRSYPKKDKKDTNCSKKHNVSKSAKQEKQDISYHTAEETWGTKDPDTPKQNPKIGQFQQSPSVPLSKNT